MKNKTTSFSILLGCVLGAAFSPSALANHRTGDFALPGVMQVADFDQDGNVDLAVNVEGFDNVAVFAGDGQGGFTLKHHFETDTLPKGLAVGDVNTDGHLDLVSIMEWGYNIRVNLGDGLGGFHFANELNGDGEPTRILLEDLNHDGHLDIVANAQNEGKVLIYFGDGNGGFSPSALELELTKNDYAIASADFNNDGNLDIAATVFWDSSVDGSDILIFLGDGIGGFTEGITFGTNPQPSALDVADMNKDGNLDLVVAGAGADNDSGIFLSTYLGDGNGNFAVGQINELGSGSIKGEIAIADFNEDGNLDVAFPQSSKLTIRHDHSTTLLVFLGDGTGNLTAGQSVTVGQEPDTAVASDFNKDGHVDLVVSNRTDATVSILLGNGDGTFTTHATIPVASLPTP
jgi:hypothetical protein